LRWQPVWLHLMELKGKFQFALLADVRRVAAGQFAP
jgi:hypothetical protein